MPVKPYGAPEQDDSFLGVLNRNKRTLILGFGIFFLVLFANPFACIGTGNRGVITTFGAVSDRVLDEGIHIVVPFIQRVHQVDVQIQKQTVEATAASKDMQNVHSKITLNYHVAYDKVNWVYQNVGGDYEDHIIAPSVQEIVKASTAKYDASNLITNREVVKNEMEDGLRKRLITYNIIVDQVAIENFAFSEQFAQAIEAKQAAEQNALKAQRDLERIKTEAEQKVATARAEGQAFQLQAQSLTPQMIQMEWIKKWKGDVPQVSGGANFMFQMPLPAQN